MLVIHIVKLYHVQAITVLKENRFQLNNKMSGKSPARDIMVYFSKKKKKEKKSKQRTNESCKSLVHPSMCILILHRYPPLPMKPKSSFNNRLIQPCCLKEQHRKSFLPSVIRLYNSH